MEMTEVEMIEEIHSHVVEKLGKERAFAWWGVGNPLLGGLTPGQLIAIRKTERLHQAVKTLIKESSPPDPKEEKDE